MALRQIKGVGTIVWGTGGVANIPNGAIIESISITPKNAAPIEIEDNDGITAFEVLLRDGFNAKVSVLYDATKTWPIEGGNMALTLPLNGASANSIPYGEGNGASYANGAVTYTVWIAAPPEQSYAKKKEMTMNFDLTYRPNIAV